MPCMAVGSAFSILSELASTSAVWNDCQASDHFPILDHNKSLSWMVSNDSQQTKLQRVHLPMLLFAFLSPTVVSELFRGANFTKGGLLGSSSVRFKLKEPAGRLGLCLEQRFFDAGTRIGCPVTQDEGMQDCTFEL